MNNQVKQYFTDLRIMRIKNSIVESMNRNPNCIKIINEAVGTEVQLTIDQEDVKWVNIVRRAFYVQNKYIYEEKEGKKKYKLNQDRKRQTLDSNEIQKFVPPPDKVLALRYALLAQGTNYHKYIKEWNKHKETFDIYEILNIGGGKRTKPKLVAEVNETMRKLYANFHNVPFVENPSNKFEAYEKVADWWMEYNKNAIHTYVKPNMQKKAKGLKFPKPAFKVVKRRRVGSREFIDLIYLTNTRADDKIREIKANNIPIDIDVFRRKAEAEGYRETGHAQEILQYSKWDNFLDKEREGKGGAKKFDPSEDKNKSHKSAEYIKIIEKKSKGPKHFKPGYLKVDENSSDVFMNLYNSEYTFRNAIDLTLFKAFKSELLKLRGIIVNVSFTPAKTKGEETRVRFYKNSLVSNSAINEDKINDMFSEARINFLNKTGKIKDENWLNYWEKLVYNIENKSFIKDDTEFGKFENSVHRNIFSAVSYAITTNIPLKSRKPSIVTGQGQSDSEGSGSTGQDFANLAGSSDRSDYRSADSSIMADEEREERVQMIKNVLTNPTLLAKNPIILQNIKKLAEEDPHIKELLASWDIDLDNLTNNQDSFSINYDDFSLGDEADLDDKEALDDEEDLIGTSKQFDHYSFANYVKKRINENGV